MDFSAEAEQAPLVAQFASISRVTFCARARSSDAADGAVVDAIELAVGAGCLGLVRGCSAGCRGLTVIACIALATSRARARSSDAADGAAGDKGVAVLPKILRFLKVPTEPDFRAFGHKVSSEVSTFETLRVQFER